MRAVAYRATKSTRFSLPRSASSSCACCTRCNRRTSCASCAGCTHSTRSTCARCLLLACLPSGLPPSMAPGTTSAAPALAGVRFVWRHRAPPRAALRSMQCIRLELIPACDAMIVGINVCSSHAMAAAPPRRRGRSKCDFCWGPQTLSVTTRCGSPPSLMRRCSNRCKSACPGGRECTVGYYKTQPTCLSRNTVILLIVL